MAFALSACDSTHPKTNSISNANLTEQEKAILSTTSDHSFVFDFNVGDQYKKVTVWIEKYKSGQLVNDKMSRISTEIKDHSSIIFTTSKTTGQQKQLMFNVGISGHDGTSAIHSLEPISKDGLDNMASMWGSFPGKNIPIKGDMVLASICYSDQNGISSLSSDFFNDADSHMDELKKYNVVYLLRSKFTK